MIITFRDNPHKQIEYGSIVPNDVIDVLLSPGEILQSGFTREERAEYQANIKQSIAGRIKSK